MDLKLVQKLLDMIGESDVDEVSIEEGEFKISIKKRSEPSGDEPVMMHYQMPPQQPPAAAAAQPESASPAPAQSTDTSASKGETFRSPIVGTFYRSPSPDSDPFVNEGTSIQKGDTLCIIEAMKIMNEIEAEYSGEVVEILAEDGQPVEYDQPLFTIKKA